MRLDTRQRAEADAAAEASDAAEEANSGLGEVAELLTVEGFDYDKVIEMIDGSELNAMVKTSTKAALTQARDNPEMLEGVLEKLKDAMGLTQ